LKDPPLWSKAVPALLPAIAALDDRRLRMFAQADGRVLDLNDYSSQALRALVDDGDRFDTIVSILQISVAADAAALCQSLVHLLADDGRLLFLEPTSAVGVTGAAQHAFGGWVRAPADA
jgi:SAM-dependent methyltransferase